MIAWWAMAIFVLGAVVIPPIAAEVVCRRLSRD